MRLSRKLADSVDGDEFIDITVIQNFLEAELIARENVELTSMSQSGGSSVVIPNQIIKVSQGINVKKLLGKL